MTEVLPTSVFDLLENMSSSGSSAEPGDDGPDTIGRTYRVATPIPATDAVAEGGDSPNAEEEYHC